MNQQFYRFSFQCKYNNLTDFINDESYYNFIMNTNWIKNGRHLSVYNDILTFKKNLNKVVNKELNVGKLPKIDSSLFTIKKLNNLKLTIKSPKFTFGKYKGLTTSHQYHNILDNDEYKKFVHYVRQSYTYQNEEDCEWEKENYLNWLNDSVIKHGNISLLCDCEYCKYIEYIKNKRIFEKKNYIDDFINKYIKYIRNQFTIYYKLEYKRIDYHFKAMQLYNKYEEMYEINNNDINIPIKFKYYYIRGFPFYRVVDDIINYLYDEETIKKNKKINYNNIKEELAMLTQHPSRIQKHLSFYDDDEETAFENL